MEWAEILEVVRWVLYEMPLFKLQDHTVTLSHILMALAVFSISIIISKWVRYLLKKRLFVRMGVDAGLTYALLRMVHYVILVAGAYIALTSMNVPLTGLTALFAFLGVGIGFGFQNLVNNFVSGILLLFERPIKIGDRITVDDIWGDVKRINLRTTVVNSVDNISIIIPNSKLLENNLINWSYGDQRIRFKLSVGVAYGSDVDLVTTSLFQAAEEVDMILKAPEPKVLFVEFGDSSLNFELYCWISDSRFKPKAMDLLNRKIDHIFRENEIEIPFPQRDLHMRQSAAPLPVLIEKGMP